MSDTLWIDEKMYVVDDEVAVYCEKLEDELAEAKANHRTGAETAIRIHAKQEVEIAELKRQIAEGNLIPLAIVTEWLDNMDIGEGLQVFAKRKMNYEKSNEVEVNSTDLLESLASECRKLVNASGLEAGSGGGWESYDCLLIELRTRLKAAEAHLAKHHSTRVDNPLNI